MKKILLLAVLTACNAKPFSDGTCNSAGITAYKGWPNDDDGAVWCKYDGYWWQCTLDGNYCDRRDKLKAEEEAK